MSATHYVALLCLGLLGCPQTASPNDSTSASGGSTGGASTGTSASTNGSSATGSTGTTSQGSTGGSTGSASFAFSEQGLPSGADGVNGISGRSATDLYAVTGDGWVLHASGATWTRVFTTPSNNGLSSVFAGSDGKVWVGGEGGFFMCSQHCADADAAPFVRVDLQGIYCRALEALCGHDADVYALCDQQGSGLLLLQSGGNWASQPVPEAYVLDKCAALPDGKVLVTAQGKIFRFDPSLGVAADAIQFPPGTRPEYAYFSAIWGDGAHEFASTNGGRIYSWSSSDSAWKPLVRPTAINAYAEDGYRVFVGNDSSEVYALGQAGDDHPAARWDGAAWNDLLDFGGGGYSYFSGWQAGPNDLWLGGVRRNSNDGFIVHAHR